MLITAKVSRKWQVVIPKGVRQSLSLKPGDKITFDKVLLIDDNKDTKIGEPYLDKAKVEAKFIEEARDPKIRIMQFKSKSNYLKRKGHRQTFHKVEITKI